VNRLARIFLEMRARDADAFFIAVFIANHQLAVFHDRQFVLADLVTLRQVRIKIVFPRENGAIRDGRIHGQPEFGCHADDLAVQYRQYARVAEVDQARLGIGVSTVSR
jgi:hypothetical protein